jgi:LuxR family transcriptional regulator, quorum-sensing system regulator BjaR1
VYYVIDWPESWRRFYLNSKLIERDPIIDALSYRQEPFTWSDLRKLRKFGKAGREALQLLASHGWAEGLIVPLPGAFGRMGLVSMAGTRAGIDRESVAHLSLLSVGFHYHVKAMVVRQGFARPPAGLTPRELACIKRVARGQSDREVAAGLRVATSTAHEFIEKAKHRLKVRTRSEMVAVAASLGIIDL